MKTISVMIHKGGQTKTTTSMHLGYALHKQGSNVLMVDLDPNAGMSRRFGFADMCDALYLFSQSQVVSVDISNKSKYKFDVVRSWSDLSKVDIQKIKFDTVKKALSKIQGTYEYCIIDCPPSDTNIALNALVASDYLLIPCVPDINGIEALNKTLQFTKGLKEKGFNKGLEILGILLNSVGRWIEHKSTAVEIRSQNPGLVFDVQIPHSADMFKAQKQNKLIGEYDSKHRVNKAYNSFIKEVKHRL